MTADRELQIAVGAQTVSALLREPQEALACYVMAHGAGVGMRHKFMSAVAAGLSERGIATLRYQFPFVEHGRKRPDSPKTAQEAVRAAVEEGRKLCPRLPLFAGGKSYGARMTSQAQAEHPLTGVRGLIFFGFPLHPPTQPSDARAKHLSQVAVPMLFIQGTSDAFAQSALLGNVVAGLGNRAELAVVEDADHSLHVPSRSGKSDAEVLCGVLDRMLQWIKAVSA